MAKKKKNSIADAVRQAAQTTKKTSKKAISQGKGTRSARTSSGSSRYQEGQYGQLIKNSRLQRNKSAAQREQEKKERNECTKQRIQQSRKNNQNRASSTYGELNKTAQKNLNKARKSNTASRIKDATVGTAYQIKGSHETTFYAIRNPNENKYINAEEYRKRKGEKNVSKFTEGSYGQLLKRERSGNKEQREKDLKKASKTIEKGNKKLEKAKEGLGSGGQFAVDAYSALLGVGSDMMLGPGSMGSMASRSFGGAYDQAKKEGADDSQAALYGFSQAAVETATEKMWSVATPLRKLYGKGAGDELTEKLLNKIVAKTKTGAGKELAYNGSKIMMSALTEGLEEMVSEGVEPAIANAIYAEAVGNPHSTSASDLLYAGALGGVMGGVFGGSGQIVDTSRGRRISDNAENIFGEGGVMELVRKGLEADEDAGTQRKAAAYKEMIETGNGIANAQVAELAREVGIQQAKDEQNYDIASRAADNRIKEGGLVPVTTTVVDEDGNSSVVMRENTQKAFDARKTENVNAINEYTGKDLQLPEMQVERIADSIAAIQTGVAGINDVSLFTVTNPEAREIYAYITNDSLPRTNRETKQHLFEVIANNRVASAEAETQMFKESVKGLIEQDMARDYSQSGQEAFAQIADAINVADPMQMNYAIATFDDFYNAGRAGMTYEEVAQADNPTYAYLPAQQREAAFRAGENDRILEQDTISGKSVTMGQAFKEVASQGRAGSHRGRLISELSNETRKTLTSTEQRFFRQMARVFNINIHIVDEQNANGAYVDGEMYISINADRALPYVFAHEITHHMQEYAPEEYLAFKNLIRDRWTREGGISEAIRAKQEHYKEFDKELTQDEALDEIVADSTYEMLQDENFISEICQSNRGVARAILDAITELLSKIRKVLVEGESFTPKQNAELLSNLDILKDAEKLWTDGLMKATENRGVVGSARAEKRRSSINADMSSRDRYEVLKTKRINVAESSTDALANKGVGETAKDILDTLKTRDRKHANKVIKPLATALGVIKNGYYNDSLNLKFNYSKNNLNESTVKQLGIEGDDIFVNFAKMLSCFDSVVENAELVEVHKDKYVGTRRENTNLENMYVLVSAFRDGTDIVPVKLEIKELNGIDNVLYVTVAAQKIKEAEIVGQFMPAVPGGSSPHSTSSTVSLAKLLPKIKDETLKKYIPHEFYEKLSLNANTRQYSPTDSPDIRYSFAGERATNADNEALAKAKKMHSDSVDMEKIRKETGWFIGGDGKWRFEIDDSKMEIHTGGKFHRNPDIRRYWDLLEKVYFLNSGSDAEMEELESLDKNLEGVSMSPTTLGDLIEYPELFEAYPGLKDVGVGFSSSMGGTNASYYPTHNEVVINKDLQSNERKLKKTLAHEIQHMIQEAEGFSGGGSVRLYDVAMRTAEEEFDNAADLYHAAAENLTSLLDNAGYLKKRGGYVDITDKKEHERIKSEYPDLADVVDDFIEYMDGFAEAEAKFRKLSEMSPMGFYENLQGEVEARDVGNRAHYSDEERASIPPDVRSDSILREDYARFSLPDENTITDYANEHETEFADVPPVRNYEIKAASRKQKSVQELEEQVETLKADKKLTHGRTLDRRSIKEEVNRLVATLMTHSESYTIEGKPRKVNAEVVNTLTDNISRIYTAIRDGDFAQASIMSYEAARETVESIDIVDDAMFNEYKELRDYLRNTKIEISEDDSSSIPDFAEFKKEQRGRIRIVSEGGIPVDTAYAELTEMYPEFFGSDVEHPADQLMRMAEVRETLEPYDVMLSEEATQALVKFAAQDILNIAATGKPWQSFADRKKAVYDESLKRLKARHQEAMRDVRKRERERAMRMVNREKTKAREYKKKQKEKKVHAERYGAIFKNYKWLSDRLVKPTDDKHIPEGFRKSLADLLMHFDFQKERSKALEKKYKKPSQKTIKMVELRAKYAEIAKEDDTGIFQYDGYVFELMDSLATKLEGKTIDSATNAELKEIDFLLKAIRHNIQMYNKAFSDNLQAGIEETAHEAMTAATVRLAKYKDGKHHDRTGIMGGLDLMFNESMVTPRDFFELVGGGINKAFLSIRKGFDVHVRNIERTRKFFDEIFKPYNKRTKIMKRNKPGSELEDWRDDTYAQEFPVEGGTIRLSPAQIMSLYCLSKRDQAMNHILGSGIVASRIDKASKWKRAVGAKVETRDSAVMVTYEDVQNIIGHLTEEQREMADRIQDYLNNECAEWGNETSMRLYGYRKFTEKNYFPIQSSDAYIDKDIASREAVEKIKNFGFTKGTVVNANNPIMIDDVFKVAADHINKMSLYNAFAAPISDFMRVYNYKERDSETGLITGSVRGMMGDAYGKKAIGYIKNFLADLNGQAQGRPEGFTRFITTSLANYKKAAIAANFRVALQQPTAIIRAFTVMNPKYFTGNINVKKNLRDMKEHCPVARWKSWGFSQVDMARDMDDIMMNNEWSRFDAYTMQIYGGLDNVTWSFIWGAVRKEIADTHPNVKVDSAEFYELCNERASEVFEKTQVVDSVFNKSEVMRNKDAMSKVITSFMAEPTRTFNMVRTELAKAHDMWRAGDKRQAVGKANRALSVYVLNAITVSAAAAIADALRDKAPGDDDDDTSWFANFLSNFIDNVNPVNMVPVAGDIWGVKDGWSIENMALAGYEDLMKSTLALINEPSLENLKGLSEGLGYVTGIPVKNIYREMDTLLKAVGIDVFAAEDGSGAEKEGLVGKMLNALQDKLGIKSSDNTGASGHDRGDKDYYGIYADDGRGIFDKLGKKSESERKRELREKRVEDILKDAEGLTGSERQDAIWDAATEGYTKYVEDGEFGTLREMRATLKAAGGDVDLFDERVEGKVASAMKKNIGSEKTSDKVIGYKDYLVSQGYTEEQISHDIIAKSDLAKELKKSLAFDEWDKVVDQLTPLKNAGLTLNDLIYLYDNRYRGIDASEFSTGEFAVPVTGRISSEFGYRNSPTAGASSNHKGIDIAAALGSAVGAADGGKVVYTGYDNARGYYVDIKHANGIVTRYQHLDSYGVEKGQYVKKGQKIAEVGSTGVSTGPHLHLEVRLGYSSPIKNPGEPVNPRDYFNF